MREGAANTSSPEKDREAAVEVARRNFQVQ
jgi:hypothetical protein